MNLGFTSIFTLAACIAIPLLNSRQALLLVALASCMGTYAVEGAGLGFRLLPGAIVAMVFCTFWVLRLVLNRKYGLPNFPGALWLYSFMVYALILTLLAPQIWGSQISVIRPNLVADGIRETQPLELTSSTFGQLIYLFLAIILFLAALSVGRKSCFRISAVLQVQIRIASIMAAIVILETLSGISGKSIDVFSWLMGSSLFEIRLDRYALDDVFGVPIRRGQAIFGEPSYFSAYLLGIWGAAIVRVRSYSNQRRTIQIVLVLMALLCAFSTTAVVGVFVVGVLALQVPLANRKKLHRSSTRMLVMIAVTLIVMALLTAMLTRDAMFDYLFGKLGNVAGYEEGNYSSGAERFYWDLVAFQALMGSWGAGVGAGGTRASSFFLNFIASYGIPGLLLLGGLCIQVVRRTYSRIFFSEDHELRAALLMWIGWIVGLALSVPDGISFFYVWIYLGFLLGHLGNAADKSFPRSMKLQSAP